MPMSNYPNGFAAGVSIRGLPINLAFPGEVFYLNNSGVLAKQGLGASDNNKGTYQQPFLTLNGAMAACLASRGDIIMVMPGHAENISSATALTIAKRGICVLGLGSGGMRPKFTLDTANTSTVNITADDIAFINCRFIANFAAIASCFTLTNAKNFSLSYCELLDTSAILNFARIVTSSTVANANDGIYIESSNWYGLGATSASCLIKMQGTNDRLIVKNCYIAHKATTDAGLMPISTGKVITNMVCTGNTFNLVGNTGMTTGTLVTTDGTTNSGILANNYIQSLDATTEILVTASSGFIFDQNYSSAVADKSGYLVPAADA